MIAVVRSSSRRAARHAGSNVLAVTLEPAGGVPAPTGSMYLVGPVN